MKKVLIVLLVLCVGAGAFAQEITPYGSLRLDFGGTTTVNDGTASGAYEFNAHNSGTAIGLAFGAENFQGNVQWSPGDNDTGLTGSGTLTLADILDLKIGLGWLPSAYWSPLSIFGNSNYSIGATSLGQTSYVQLGVKGFYLGVGAMAEKAHTGKAKTPAFFAGYDYNAEKFSVGATFTGQFISDAKVSVDVSSGSPVYSFSDAFPILGTIHGRVSPTEKINILLNVGLYVAPAYFDVNGNGGAGVPVLGNGLVGRDVEVNLGGSPTMYDNLAAGDAIVIEAMLGAGIGITEKLGFDVTFGYKNDLGKKTTVDNMVNGTFYFGGGSALQIGVDANLKLSDNFTLTPGLTFYKVLTAAGGSDLYDSTVNGGYDIADPSKVFSISYGVSLKYAF